MRILPSDLLREPALLGDGPLAVDTEGSGLHVDDGARVSAASIAFYITSDHRWWNLEDGREFGLDHTFTIGPADSDDLRIVSIAWPFDQGVEGTGKPEDDGSVALWSETENLPESEWQAFLTVLVLSGELVFHNVKHDLHQLRAGTRLWGGRDLSEAWVWDTMGVCREVWPWFNSMSLKVVASKLWPGEDLLDEQTLVKEYLRKSKLPKGRWDLIPWTRIGRYADLDARLTLRLWTAQQKTLSASEDGEARFGRIWKIFDVTQMLYNMERRGMPYNKVESIKTSIEAKRRAKELEEALPFSPPTATAAKKFWFTEQGVEPDATTATGAPQLNAEVVAGLVARDIQGAYEWQEYQKITSADSNWYSGYADKVGEDGRLRGSVRQFGTVSGRFSIERVSLQMVPQDYRLQNDVLKGLPTPRDLIRSGIPEGCRMFELDLANAELRIGALKAGCQKMLSAFAEGQDLHGLTAKELFDVDEGSPQWTLWRHIGKQANFSLIFGVGAGTFGQMLSSSGSSLTHAEVQHTVWAWNRLYPEFKQIIDRMMAAVERRKRLSRPGDGPQGWGYIKYRDGSRRWYGEHRHYRGQEEEVHSAFNQWVQGSLARLAAEWWLRVNRMAEDKWGVTGGEHGLGVKMTVHDSVILMVPDTQEGLDFVEAARLTGLDVWNEMVPGVGGGVDVKEFGT